MYVEGEEEVSCSTTPTPRQWEIDFDLTNDRGRVIDLKFRSTHNYEDLCCLPPR